MSFNLKKVLLFTIVITILVISVLYFFNSKSNDIQNKEIDISMNSESLIENINLGKALYVKNCASCHGVNLQGQPNWSTKKDADGHNLSPPLNGTGHTWHHSEDQLFNVIKYGFKIYNENYDGKMQGNDELSDNDIWAILDYIKSVWPQSIQKKYKSMTKH